MKAVPVFAFNPGPITGEGNWTWFLPGRVPTLIDAGTGEQAHLDALDTALSASPTGPPEGGHDNPLQQVLVTHGHVDHASGAPALQQRFGVTRFCKLPWPERDAKWEVEWTPIHDGDVISAGDTELVAIHTPGHAPDHLCFWHEESRTALCGDLAIKGTSVWIPARLGGDLAAYLASLARILALNPRRMLPAHGPVIEDPIRVLGDYIDHRREREDQVIAALRAGDRTPEAIVSRVYRGIRESLVPLARESVAAHLVKLQQEGRVLRRRSGQAQDDQDAWTMIDP